MSSLLAVVATGVRVPHKLATARDAFRQERTVKLVALKCPSCGAQLNVDIDLKRASCQFCGAVLPIDDEVQHVQYDNASQAGYEFEMGRLRAQAEAREQEAKRQQIEYALSNEERRRREFAEKERRAAAERKRETERERRNEEQERLRRERAEKSKRGCIWVCGWILFFPAPLTVLIYRFLRKRGLEDSTSKAVLAVGWAILIIPPYLIPPDAEGKPMASMAFLPLVLWLVGFTLLSLYVKRKSMGARGKEDRQDADSE